MASEAEKAIHQFARKYRMGGFKGRPQQDTTAFADFTASSPRGQAYGVADVIEDDDGDRELGLTEMIKMIPQGFGGAFGVPEDDAKRKATQMTITADTDTEVAPPTPFNPGQINLRPEAPVEEETDTFVATQLPRQSDITLAEIERRQNKDFKGKDRDNDHNWKDVLRSAGIGALRSLGNADPRMGWEGMLGAATGGAAGGGVYGAVDRNADEKMGNEMNLERLLGEYQQQYGMEQQRDANDRKARLEEAQIAEWGSRPEIKRAETARKTAADKARLEMQEKTLNFKKDDRDRYFELEGLKLDARKAGDERKAQQFERQQTEIERRNRANEGIQLKKLSAQNNQFIQRMGLDERKFEARNKQFQQQMLQKIEADRAKGVLNAAKLKKDLAAALQAGEITQETYDTLIQQTQ